MARTEGGEHARRVELFEAAEQVVGVQQVVSQADVQPGGAFAAHDVVRHDICELGGRDKRALSRQELGRAAHRKAGLQAVGEHTCQRTFLTWSSTGLPFCRKLTWWGW